MPGQKIENSPAFVRRSSSQSMIQFKSLFEILLLMKKIDSIPDQFRKVQSAEVYSIQHWTCEGRPLGRCTFPLSQTLANSRILITNLK